MSNAFLRLKPTIIDLSTHHQIVYLLLRTGSLATAKPPRPAYTDRTMPASTTSLSSLSPPPNPLFTWSPILALPAGRGAIAISVRMTPNDKYPKYEARKIWVAKSASEMSAMEKEMRGIVEGEAKGYEDWKGAEVEVVWSREEGKVGEVACVVVKGAKGEEVCLVGDHAV